MVIPPLSKRIATELSFPVTDLDRWKAVPNIAAINTVGAGNKRLDAHRLWLAKQGVSMLGDAMPELWIDAIENDGPIPSDFVVLVDNQEKLPFDFAKIKCDADRDYRPMLVRTQVVSLGASHGDYSIQGHTQHVAMERKSLEDAIGTFSSVGDRRAAWEREMQYLASVEVAAVVIECTLGQMYSSIESRGVRSELHLAKCIQRSLISWEQEFGVPFIFCDTRELAQIELFRRLHRYWRTHS